MRVKPSSRTLRKSNSHPLHSNEILSSSDDNINCHHQNNNTSCNEESEKYNNDKYGCRRRELVVTFDEEKITSQLSKLQLQNNEHPKERTTGLIGTNTEIKCVLNICCVKQEYDNETGEDNDNRISTEGKIDNNINEVTEVTKQSALIPRDDNRISTECKIDNNITEVTEVTKQSALIPRDDNRISTEGKIDNNITEVTEVRKQSALIPRGKRKHDENNTSDHMEEDKFPPTVENLLSPSLNLQYERFSSVEEKLLPSLGMPYERFYLAANNINTIETSIDEYPSCSFTHSSQESTISANNSLAQLEELFPPDLQNIMPFDPYASETMMTQDFNATSQEPSQISQNWLNQHLISQPYRDQFLKRLHPTKKKEALIKVSLVTDSALIMPDDDGDTLLMCLVSQPNDSLLELVFFVIERIRNNQNALKHKNKMDQTALYVASINQPQEPLIACYIAATLLDLGVDIAQETYGRGLTLIQCLQCFGQSHEKVLTSLLNMKDASGRTVFSF